MLQEIPSPGDKVFIWLDEKILTVDPQVNIQNNRILAASSARIDPLVQNLSRRWKAAGIMVWAAVILDGLKSFLLLLKEGVKVKR